MRPRAGARFEPRDAAAGALDALDVPKPYKVTALPPIHRRLRSMKPIPGVSYLATSGLYDDLVGDRKRVPLGHMTRRNITEHKISSNILTHNSPVVVQNFDSLNLGPQLPRHRRFASTFGHPDAAIDRQSLDLMGTGRDPQQPNSLGYSSSKSGAKMRVLQEYSPAKVTPTVLAHPFGPSLN